jgi:hypothetical protein
MKLLKCTRELLFSVEVHSFITRYFLRLELLEVAILALPFNSVI